MSKSFIFDNRGLYGLMGPYMGDKVWKIIPFILAQKPLLANFSNFSVIFRRNEDKEAEKPTFTRLNKR